MKKLLVISTLLFGTAAANATTDTVTNFGYDQIAGNTGATISNAVSQVSEQAAAFAAFASAAASNGCATGIERCATPMTLSNCPAGQYWTTEGTGVAHCVSPPPPPPPVVYVPWEPPTTDTSTPTTTVNAPMDSCAVYGWCSSTPVVATPTDTVTYNPPPTVVTTADGCNGCGVYTPPPLVVHDSAPVVTPTPVVPTGSFTGGYISDTQIGPVAVYDSVMDQYGNYAGSVHVDTSTGAMLDGPYAGQIVTAR